MNLMVLVSSHGVGLVCVEPIRLVCQADSTDIEILRVFGRNRCPYCGQSFTRNFQVMNLERVRLAIRKVRSGVSTNNGA